MLPRMDVKGVLSSCVTLATNSLRIRSSFRRRVTSEITARADSVSWQGIGAVYTVNCRPSSPVISRLEAQFPRELSLICPAICCVKRLPPSVSPCASDALPSIRRALWFRKRILPFSPAARTPSLIPSRTPFSWFCWLVRRENAFSVFSAILLKDFARSPISSRKVP